MPKIVIAGGTGFLGQSLANYLQNHEYEVVIIARHETCYNSLPTA